MIARLSGRLRAASLLALAALLPSALRAADLATWPSQYTIRPWETSRLTAADVVGPDGIVYPDFTGVGVTSGIPDVNNATVRSTYSVFNVTTYGANGSDTISDNLNVAAASSAARAFLNANPANKAILYFPAGTYYLSAPVVFTQSNIVIDGDGPASTVLKLQTEVGQSGALLTIQRAPAFAGYLTATALVPRGGNTLTLNSDPAANGYSVGTWLRLAPTVSGAGTTVSDRYSNPDNHVVFSDAYYHLGRILFASGIGQVGALYRLAERGPGARKRACPERRAVLDVEHMHDRGVVELGVQHEPSSHDGRAPQERAGQRA
jgi:hypothetical protein